MNTAIAHLKPGHVITSGIGSLVPSGTVASVDFHIGSFPAADALESNDYYLRSTNAAFQVVYEDGSRSEWVCGSRRLHVEAGV